MCPPPTGPLGAFVGPCWLLPPAGPDLITAIHTSDQQRRRPVRKPWAMASRQGFAFRAWLGCKSPQSEPRTVLIEITAVRVSVTVSLQSPRGAPLLKALAPPMRCRRVPLLYSGLEAMPGRSAAMVPAAAAAAAAALLPSCR